LRAITQRCLVPECPETRKYASDYCPGHTHRLRRYGSPTGLPLSRYSKDATEKRCTRCKKTRLLAEFGPMKNGQLGLKPKCLECEAEIARVRRQNELPEQRLVRLARRRADKRARYGPKAAVAWEERVIHHGLGCEVCGTTEGDIGIDHDHGCEAGHPISKGCDQCYRGILCSSCNGALGLLGEDVDRMMALVSYQLTRGGGEKVGRDSTGEAGSGTRRA
jgi:hypothetical protein